MSAALTVADLVTGFGPEVIHDGLSLELRRGEVPGMVGGSGTGKSVLLRAIIGLNAPRAGRIDLLGTQMTGAGAEPRRAALRRTGMTFQDGALFSSLTSRENVEALILELKRALVLTVFFVPHVRQPRRHLRPHRRPGRPPCRGDGHRLRAARDRSSLDRGLSRRPRRL
jgi:ABC-type branched-subunit amino acid transport system ATPase component